MISYELPSPDDIQIEIINAYGAIVSMVELGWQEAGKQSSAITIPSEISQGVYHLRIRGNGYEGPASKLIVTK